MKCEKCGQEINTLLVDVFRRDGGDDFYEHPVFECEENAAYIETTPNWTGYELSEEEMIDTIACPHCKQFPFQSNDPDAEDEYDLDRLAVMCNQRMTMREEVSQRFSLTAKIPLDRLRELAEADREGRCVVMPAGIGDTVYHITTCKNFSQVLDGTMYGPNGELGTATGLYCPCELAETCPFPCDDDGSFDCEKHKNTLAIFEDAVTGILSDDMQDTLFLEYSGNAAFDEFGKTVFLTREEAEAALAKIAD